MDLTSIDPAKLRHFITVLDSGAFALAARRLGISQPAVSKSVRAIEDRLGIALFERGRAGARPTKEAMLLGTHARVILAEYALAEAELRAFSNAEGGTLAIGASLSLAQSLLPDAIARFRRRWPEVALAVTWGCRRRCSRGCSTASSTSWSARRNRASRSTSGSSGAS